MSTEGGRVRGVGALAGIGIVTVSLMAGPATALAETRADRLATAAVQLASVSTTTMPEGYGPVTSMVWNIANKRLGALEKFAERQVVPFVWQTFLVNGQAQRWAKIIKAVDGIENGNLAVLLDLGFDPGWARWLGSGPWGNAAAVDAAGGFGTAISALPAAAAASPVASGAEAAAAEESQGPVTTVLFTLAQRRGQAMLKIAEVLPDALKAYYYFGVITPRAFVWMRVISAIDTIERRIRGVNNGTQPAAVAAVQTTGPGDSTAGLSGAATDGGYVDAASAGGNPTGAGPLPSAASGMATSGHTVRPVAAVPGASEPGDAVNAPSFDPEPSGPTGPRSRSAVESRLLQDGTTPDPAGGHSLSNDAARRAGSRSNAHGAAPAAKPAAGEPSAPVGRHSRGESSSDSAGSR